MQGLLGIWINQFESYEVHVEFQGYQNWEMPWCLVKS